MKPKVYIEVRKSKDEVVCLKAPTEAKLIETSAVLDVLNTELNLGLELNLHVDLSRNEKWARHFITKWNKLMNRTKKGENENE